VAFSSVGVEVAFRPTADRGLKLEISCKQKRQLSSLAQICNAAAPRNFVTAVEHLYICEIVDLRPFWKDDIENTQWLGFLRPFTTLKNLYLSRGVVPHMASALQLEEMAMDVLPALQNVCLEQPSKHAHENTALALSSRRVDVHDWDGERCMWWIVK
jgi:hypothetical protein